MIRFFQNSYPLQYIAVFLMALMLWIPSFITPCVVAPLGMSPLYDFIVSHLAKRPVVLSLLAFVLVLVEAMIFNGIMKVGKVEPKTSAIGMFVYVLAMGITPEQTCFTPAVLSAAFLMPVIYILYKMPSLQSPEIPILNAGICLAMAAMSCIYSVIILLWAMLALSIQRSGTARLQLILVAGFLLPYFFYFGTHFIIGDIVEIVGAVSEFFVNFSIDLHGFDMFSIVVLVFLLAISFLPLSENSIIAHDRLAEVRQNISLATLMFVFALVMLLLDGRAFQCGLVFVALSVHNTYSLTHVAKFRWPEIVLDIIVLLICLRHYLPLFE